MIAEKWSVLLYRRPMAVGGIGGRLGKTCVEGGGRAWGGVVRGGWWIVRVPGYWNIYSGLL